jgi:hypothetical protein
MTNDPFREMASALRSRAGLPGTVLKFKKGQWLAGKDHTSMNNAELIAHVDQAMFGWIKWEFKKQVDFNLGFVAQRFHPKMRSELSDTDREQWIKDDPWQLTFLLPLTDLENGTLFMFSTISKGGRDALANLQDAYADNREFHPEDAHKLPLVCLSGDHYPHPDFGRVDTPTFDLIKWVDPPADFKRIQLPAPASRMLAIEHKAVADDELELENPDAGGGSPFDDDIPY